MVNGNEKEMNSIQKVIEGGRKHAPILIKAGIAGIPVIGGVLNSLINDYMPDKKLERVLKFIEDLKEKVEEMDDIEEKVQKGFIHRDEFAYLFEKTMKAVLENYQKEKIECFKKVLVNSLRFDDVKAEEQEMYINIVNDMPVLHLRVFRLLVHPRLFNQERGNPIRDDFSGSSGSRLGIISALVPEVDKDHLKPIIVDLNNKGLIQLQNPETMISRTDIGMLDGLVTEFGNKFANYVINYRK